jgi:Mlc titration factor MtfA (ptsG expression regulator)
MRRLFTRTQTTRNDSAFDPALWQLAEQRLPFLGHLTADERQQLRALTEEFLDTKEFHGAHDLQVDNEIRLNVALQACLLILHLGLESYDDWIGIIIYPGDFVIPRQVMDEAGVVHEYDDAVLGEAWQGGPVLLSWFAEGEEPDGINVVLHEFAHKLDMRSGSADGMPALPTAAARRAWHSAFEPAYIDFCRRVDSGEEPLLDPYAAGAPAEFFAVMSESFFEVPDLLREEYPGVYDQLRQYFRQDPAANSANSSDAQQ